jgi:transcriptional regulator with XRE-family HTH domain
MTFYERYELLCGERSMKPQTQEMQDITGVSSPSISGWKNGSMPKADVLCRLARYFDVTTDYLLGLSEVRKSQAIPSLTEQEQLLLSAFRSVGAAGQFRIIQVCMNERDAAEKGETINAG